MFLKGAGSCRCRPRQLEVDAFVDTGASGASWTYRASRVLTILDLPSSILYGAALPRWAIGGWSFSIDAA
jgi:hypothetical protein